jgi:hypothetical protein
MKLKNKELFKEAIEEHLKSSISEAPLEKSRTVERRASLHVVRDHGPSEQRE